MRNVPDRYEIKIMLRFFSILIVVLLTFAACSRDSNPVNPDIADLTGIETGEDQPGISPLDYDSGNGAVEIWGALDFVWDPDNEDLVLLSRVEELAAKHYKVSMFLTPPFCDDCITAELVSSSSEYGTFDFDVTIKNDTSLWGYDVRGIVQVKDSVYIKFLNPEGYTNLFAAPGYQSPAPYRVFGDVMAEHAFAPGYTFTERFSAKVNPGSGPSGFRLIVTAGYPSAPGDPSIVSDFSQAGDLYPGGGSAWLRCMVKDLQFDVSGVCVDTSPLGGGDVWLDPVEGIWQVILSNPSAGPGIYTLKVDAYSPNAQNAVTSNFFRVVVFHQYPDFRGQMLTLLNNDRATEGLPPLSVDAELNTVAQAHAQDMADQVYFSHINLDGWTPWQRMEYYGVDYSAAGENIAVGQDTPQDVETAWMNSSGHRANIMNDDFGHVGFGIVPTGAGDPYAPGFYWVQVFTD